MAKYVLFTVHTNDTDTDTDDNDDDDDDDNDDTLIFYSIDITRWLMRVFSSSESKTLEKYNSQYGNYYLPRDFCPSPPFLAIHN
jgi:hypothetical protein